MSGLLFQAFVYLCAAVIAVPIAKRLGLGSVLGYLIAGILIGPAMGLVGAETQDIQHFAEFGVVMMLFLVGLELEPSKLWTMRSRLLGMGGLQVGGTAIVVCVLALTLGVEWRAAIAVALVLSLSSTAIVLQTLGEKGLIKTDGGNASFSVLLFQDVAVIAMLALVPLLAAPGAAEIASSAGDGHHGTSLVADLPGWAYALVVLGAVAAVVLGGHFLSRPLFRFIASSRLREVFTAAALLLVVGIALLMSLVQLSPALGTFLAGVVLANSEFKHELESNIEPFKGLLLGLFFITVGAGIDFDALIGDPVLIAALTVGLIAVKATILYSLARAFKLAPGDRWLFSLGLAQAGEFGFVMISFSVQNHAIGAELSQLLSLVVALSMLLTPGLFILYDRWLLPRLAAPPSAPADTIDEQGTVIIAGVGRFGQIVNRMLVAAGVRTVVLDHEATMVDLLRKVGIKTFYGDASRSELLHAAGIHDADMFVVAIDDRDRALEMVEYVRRDYPHVKILARAFDVRHLWLLRKAGVDVAIREMFAGSLELSAEALKLLGFHPFKVEKMTRAFRVHDREGIEIRYQLWEKDPNVVRSQSFLTLVKEHREVLSDVMATDRLQLHDRSERGWTPPPKGYTKKFEDADDAPPVDEIVSRDSLG